MKWFLSVTQYILILFFLTACTSFVQNNGDTETWIRPGDQIGNMTVAQGEPALPYPSLLQFCENFPLNPEPGTHSSHCDVPELSGLALVVGWLAKETKLESNWEAMQWSLSIDGYPIALEDFKWFEFDHPQHGEDNISRVWIIDLLELPPGAHTITHGWTSDVDIDDGLDVFKAGTYELVVDFIVLKKPIYPDFLSTFRQADPVEVNTSQNSFTSETAGLDFLLYFPKNYIEEPRKQWPLIFYLHGVHLRGATLDLLRNEPLSRKLDKDGESPFIFVSPLGDGGFDFWSNPEMIRSIFILLDEVQAALLVDPQRIYLIGDDMGGNGVWTTALNRHDSFAALISVGGYFGYPFEVPEDICDLKDVPIWAFHGGKDKHVPVDASEMLVDTINECGGNAQLTVKSDMTIDIIFNVYDDPELYEWLLSQTLE